MQWTQVVVQYVPADGKTPTSEEQVKLKEAKIEDFKKKHYLTQHIILSTTSTHLSSKIKNMKTAHEMWEAVKANITLYFIDAENQLEGMQLSDSSDPKTHLVELKAHFELMMQRHNNLIKMGSTFSDARLCTIIMTSLPSSYRPALQTITAAQKASAITSSSTTSMVKLKPADLIEFFTEEPQHRVIEEDRTKPGESALYVQSSKRKARGPGNGKGVSKKTKTCSNCGKPGHVLEDCWAEGGGKEGQGPRQKKSPKKVEKKSKESAAVAVEEELFAFTCTSDFNNLLIKQNSSPFVPLRSVL